MLAKDIKELAKGVTGIDFEGKIIKLAKPKPWNSYIFHSIMVKDKENGILKVTFIANKKDGSPVSESDFGKHITVQNGVVKNKKEEKDNFIAIDLTKNGTVKLSEPEKIQKAPEGVKSGEEPDNKPLINEKDEELLKKKVEYWHGVWKDEGYKEEGIKFEVFKDIAVSSFIQESNYERDLRKADYYHQQRLKQIQFQEDYKKKLGVFPYNKNSGGYKKGGNGKPSGYFCSKCKDKITKAEYSFSKKKYNKALCRDCQKEA